MLESIIEAAKNFCIHQLQKEPTLNETTVIPSSSIITSIALHTPSNQEFSVYLFFQKEFIQQVAYALLFEEQSDDETLDDMALECTNLIVGNAKVLSAQTSNTFTIATPLLLKQQPTITQPLQGILCDGSLFAFTLAAKGE